MTEARSYPRHVKTDAGDIEFRLMTRADEAAVLDFARKLPTHDLLFLPRNISEPKVLSAWVNEIERGAFTSLLAIKDGKVVGPRHQAEFDVAGIGRDVTRIGTSFGHIDLPPNQESSFGHSRLMALAPATRLT